MKVLFLFPYPIGESPSQRFRFEQYLGLLRSKGISCHVHSFWSDRGWAILYDRDKFFEKTLHLCHGFLDRLFLLVKLPGYSLIFLHREATPVGPPIFEWIMAVVFRKKIIYDFDDAIWLPNTSPENKIASWLKWHGKVKSICRWSYKVSCGNAYLADYAKKFNASVIINPTTIDTKSLHNPDQNEVNRLSSDFVVGWTGTQSTLPYVLPILPLIKSLHSVYPQLKLILIANKRPEWKEDFLEFIQWSKKSEIHDLMKIDIGLMPLPNEPWALGKCGFKALQYMSLRKPALVSPTGVNVKIVDHGANGFFCQTPEEWYRFIEVLIQNRQLCVHMGENGRQKVIDHYSIDSNTATFLSLFE